MQLGLLVTLLVATVVGPPEEAATAEELVEQAQNQFRSEDYTGAAESLARAYELDPSPGTAYAWAQAARLGGDCETAVTYYEEFLASEPPREQAEAAQANIERCDEVIAEAEAKRKAEQEERQRLAEEERQRRAEEEAQRKREQEERQRLAQAEAGPHGDDGLGPKGAEQKPWIADPLGAGLASAGIVGLGVGAGLLGGAAARATKADAATTHDDYRGLTESAIRMQRGGAIVASIGGALLIGGIVRYAVVAKKRQPGKLAITWAGSGLVGRF